LGRRWTLTRFDCGLVTYRSLRRSLLENDELLIVFNRPDLATAVLDLHPSLQIGGPTLHFHHLESFFIFLTRVQADPLVALLFINQDHEPATLDFACSSKGILLEGIFFLHLYNFLYRRNRKCRLGPEFTVASEGLLLGHLGGQWETKGQPRHKAREQS